MAATILLYDPTAPAAAPTGTATEAKLALSALAGKVVGFIDNAKPNFAQLVDDLADVLISRYGVARVIKHQKRAASVPAGADVIDSLARECDLVIAGSGD
jgi:hypothetical protein